MEQDEVDDFLAHFGVKGMKWGQRKVEGSTSENSNLKRKPMNGRTRVEWC